MACLAEISAELDRLLEPDGFADDCPNGLQVQGAAEVATAATGVSASVAAFERAIDHGADLVITHRGMFWDRDDRRVVGRVHARLKLLPANYVDNNAPIAGRRGCVGSRRSGSALTSSTGSASTTSS